MDDEVTAVEEEQQRMEEGRIQFFIPPPAAEMISSTIFPRLFTVRHRSLWANCLP